MQDSYGSLMDVTASEWLDPDQKPVPFWDIIRALSNINAQYDVIMLPDGEYRPDDFILERIKGYRYDSNGKIYIHLLNYRYDEQEDNVQVIPEMHLSVRDAGGDNPKVITPEGITVPDIESRKENGVVHIILKNVGLYAVVIF